MTFRQTAKWFVAIVLLAAAGAIGYGYVWLSRADEVLRQKLLAKQAELAPDWDVSVGRAHFDWRRRIHIYDVAIKAKGQAAPVVTLPEVILTVDREKLRLEQEVEVERVRLVRPVVDLVRDETGRWNWQALLTLKPTGRACPEWEIEQGAANILISHGVGEPLGRANLRNADIRLIPSGKREFLVKGVALLDRVGRIIADGDWKLDDKAWNVRGRIADINANPDLLALAAAWSPGVRDALVRAGNAVRDFEAAALASRDAGDSSPFSFASSQRSVTEESPATIPHLGFTGTVDLDFRIGQPGRGAPLEYRALARVRQAQLSSAAAPFPLNDAEGKVYADSDQIILRGITARHGTTRVALDGRFDRRQTGTPGALQLAMLNLQLDERLRGRLPAALRKQCDELRLTGAADIAGSLVRDDHGKWRPTGFVLTPRDCAIAHARFPYPITAITGSIKQHGNRLDLSLDGTGGRRPVHLEGTILNPGPTAETSFTVTVKDLPVDSNLIEACPPPAQPLLRDLRLQGAIDATARIVRAAGVYQPYETALTVKLNGCDMEHAEFPYRLSHLTGTVEFDTIRDVWHFRDLKARHGATRIEGGGSYALKDGDGSLDLNLTAHDGHFDRQLELALPQSIQKVWADFSPRGVFDAEIELDWSPDEGMSVAVPQADLRNAGLTLSYFRYPVDDLTATLRYTNDLVQVTSFSGTHDETRIQGAGFAEIPPAQPWRVRFTKLIVDDLICDGPFRRALPADLRSVIEELNPRGKLSLAGTLELRGDPHPQTPVTAAWDLRALFAGGRLRAGLELENLYGEVTSRGTWNGEQAVVSGAVDLSSAGVLGYQLSQVRGPYHLDETGDLVVGSRQALAPARSGEQAASIPLDDRLSARAIGGILTLDALVRLSSDPGYRLLVTLSHGQLEEYARLYLKGAENLAGVMNGWIELGSDRGFAPRHISGRGKLQINHAALYELPLMVQTFQLLNPALQDNAAFNYAFLDFHVASERFHFDTIDLAGDAVNFRGRGTIAFDGTMNLDLYSMMPRSRLPLPLVRPIADIIWTETTTGWVGIEVTGKLGQSIARLKPVPVVDEAIKRFLSAFQPPPPGKIPQFVRPILPSTQATPGRSALNPR